MMMMKNMNGGSRDGSDVQYKEGAKLLDIESTDSDSQEHFSLPPLELKGARKKKSKLKSAGSVSMNGGPGRGAGGCSCHRTFGLFMLIIAILCTGMIGYFTYRLQVEVRELKERLDSVESQSQASPDEFHGIHSTVQEIHRSIKALNDTVNTQQTNISEIFKQIGVFSKTTQNLKSSLAAYPQLVSLPEDVKDVQKQLLDLGSDLGTLKSNTLAKDFVEFKNSVTSDLTAVKERLTNIEKKTKDDGAEETASSRDVINVRNDLSTLHRKIDTLNFTISTKLYAINTSAEHQLVQIAALHNSTASLRHQIVELETRVLSMNPAATRKFISQEISRLNITSSGQLDPSALQDLHTHMNTIDGKLTIIHSQLPQLATLESVANMTWRVDAVSLQLAEEMNDLTKTVGLTTQHITELKIRLSEHDTRLGKLEGMSIQTGYTPSQLSGDKSPSHDIDGTSLVGGSKSPPSYPGSSPPGSSSSPLQGRNNTRQGDSTPAPTAGKVRPQLPSTPESQGSYGKKPTQAEDFTQGHRASPSHDTNTNGDSNPRSARGSRRSAGEEDTAVKDLLNALNKNNQ